VSPVAFPRCPLSPRPFHPPLPPFRPAGAGRAGARPDSPVSHDVFISFKNTGADGRPTVDAREARRVYEALQALGLRVFFSEVSLAESGRGHFSKSIEAALDSARVLILVASCREHLESRWVEAEWDSFLQDMRSGNRQGEMFILNCGGLSPADLPLFLRRQQMFSADELDKLVRFVASALPVPARLADLVRVSLHCLRPERNEDKVYLVAVHEGTQPGRFHVTAFWGPRYAPRLNSQLKAANVSAEEAAAEAEKMQAEKVRTGYRPRNPERILTAGARAHLRAALGLADEGPARAKLKPARRGGARPGE
jgi:hypothetical protein